MMCEIKKGIVMNSQGSIGFLAKIQQTVDSMFASLHISARDIISYVTWFGIGFLLGLGFKKYGKWVVAIILSAVIIIATLHYFEFISVHYTKIRCILGLDDVHTIEDIMTFVQVKVQTFLIELILFIIAIIVGFKLG
jgi:hypothetical protein